MSALWMELPTVRHMILTCYIFSRLPTQWHPCSGGHVSRSQHWRHLELYICRLWNQCKDCSKLPRLELVSEHMFELYRVVPCLPNCTDSFVSLFAVMPTRLVVIGAFTHTAEHKRTFFFSEHLSTHDTTVICWLWTALYFYLSATEHEISCGKTKADGWCRRSVICCPCKNYLFYKCKHDFFTFLCTFWVLVSV